MNAKFADSVSLRKPYLVHVVHRSLLVMAHSVQLRICCGQDGFESNREHFAVLFLTANNFSVILKYICFI